MNLGPLRSFGNIDRVNSLKHMLLKLWKGDVLCGSEDSSFDKAKGTRGHADPFYVVAQEASICYYGNELDDVNVSFHILLHPKTYVLLSLFSTHVPYIYL
uniref:Uncharacterized protein n=1 Tax=Tanacetum cinerariifolium TaxID=118510 RepID=A0A6L2MD57_TANCI|nr:hypothetical protein [Tanacetum cinerariifolium]